MILTGPDEIFIIGDSLTVGFSGSVPVWYVYGQQIRAAFGSVQGVPLASPYLPTVRRPWPKVLAVDAAAGRSTTNIAVDDPTMDAFLALYRPPTTVFVDLGINDADQIRVAALTGPVFQSQAQRVVNRINLKWGVPYSKIYWIGPWGHDSGDDATQILDVENRLTALSAQWGFQLCKTSQTWNPVNTVGDGTHPNQAGAMARAIPIVAAIQVAN